MTLLWCDVCQEAQSFQGVPACVFCGAQLVRLPRFAANRERAHLEDFRARWTDDRDSEAAA